VLRDGRLRYAGAIRQRMNCQFPITGQTLENRPTSRVGEGFENVVRRSLHSKTITHWLWVCQPCAVSLVTEVARRWLYSFSLVFAGRGALGSYGLPEVRP